MGCYEDASLDTPHLIFEDASSGQILTKIGCVTELRRTIMILGASGDASHDTVIIFFDFQMCGAHTMVE